MKEPSRSSAHRLGGPRPEREQTAWKVIAVVAIVLVLGGILNLLRVALLGGAVSLPAHLAPWATRAGSLEALIAAEAELRMLGDPAFQREYAMSIERERLERETLERYRAEVKGEVELIQRIAATSSRLAGQGEAPSPQLQRQVLEAHLRDARLGVLVPEETLLAELSGATPPPAAAPGEPAPAGPAPAAEAGG